MAVGSRITEEVDSVKVWQSAVAGHLSESVLAHVPASFPTGSDTLPACGQSRCRVKLITQLNYWLWASVRGLHLTFSKCQPGAELLGLLCARGCGCLWMCVWVFECVCVCMRACAWVGGHWQMESSSKWCYRLHWKCQSESKIILFVYTT